MVIPISTGKRKLNFLLAVESYTSFLHWLIIMIAKVQPKEAE